MKVDYNKLLEYAASYSTPEDEVLSDLYRETHLTTIYPRMVSGHMQGRLLELISKMICPERILEIGTFTGYSAICFARGLNEKGILHTIDINDELSEMALRYIKRAGLENKIILHSGNALEIIPTLNECFDLVFIDGDKEQYVQYYDLAFPKLRKGGFILADNVLWNGKVLPGSSDNDKESKAIRLFNNYILNDQRVEKMLLPFRDGLYILRKISD